jgi:ABC-type nitrate/sulfonate/bicarbonate transport system permease component
LIGAPGLSHASRGPIHPARVDQADTLAPFATRSPRLSSRALDPLWPILTLIGVGIIWQIATGLDTSKARIIPTPNEVLAALIRNRETLLTEHIPITLEETLLGLALALGLGVALAALLDWSTIARRALYPLLIVSQTIPIVALAPVLILIFGFGIEPKVTVVVLFCIFPITIATLDGLTTTEPNAVLLLHSMGASRWDIWRKARLPSALPGLFSGLRIAATYSVTGAIFGEYVTSNYGLGQYMRLAYASAHVDQAFVAILITAVLSVGLVGVVALLERVVVAWHFARQANAQWDRALPND